MASIPRSGVSGPLPVKSSFHTRDRGRVGPWPRRAAAWLLALILAVLPLSPAAAEDESGPLISDMAGEFRQACRAAPDVRACHFLVVVVGAYFGRAYLLERRLASGGDRVLGLKPYRSSCDDCVTALQDVEAYFAKEGVVVPFGGPAILPTVLGTACDRKFRAFPARAAQCKAELEYYLPLLVDQFLANYPPLLFCRLRKRPYCPPAS